MSPKQEYNSVDFFKLNLLSTDNMRCCPKPACLSTVAIAHSHSLVMESVKVSKAPLWYCQTFL